MSLYSCDCCKAPMVKASHYSAESCAYGDTDACVICSSQVAPEVFQPDSGTLEEEILELACHATADRVPARLVQLSAELDAAYRREGIGTDDAPITAGADVPWPFPSQPDSMLAVARDADDVLRMLKRSVVHMASVSLLDVDADVKRTAAAFVAEARNLIQRVEAK